MPLPSTRLSLVLLALVALPLAHATHGDAHCYRTSEPEITTPAADGETYYLDNDMNPDFWSVWIYHESNGIPGLQRYDEMTNDFDACTQPDADAPRWIDHDGRVVVADTVVF